MPRQSPSPCLSFAACLLAAGVFSLPIPAAEGAPLALVGATLHPVSGPAIESGVLIVEGDTLVAVGGPGTPVPEGARVVELGGQHVYPGFIRPASTLGLIEVDSVAGTRDLGELGDYNPHLRAQVAVNADSELLPVAVSGGVLAAHVVPRGGVLAGTSAVLRLEGWSWEEMTVKAPLAMHLRFPGGRSGEGEGEGEKEGAESRALTALNDFLADARAYGKARQAAAAGSGPAVEADPRLEALQPLLAGELPLHLHAGGKERIEKALDWAAEQGLTKLVLVSGPDAGYLAERLAAAGIPVILQDLFELPDRAWEPYDFAYAAPARLHAAGVRFALSADGAHNARNLPFGAAMAAAFGLPREEALASVTLRPAEILGVADRLGSLEVGKEATFFVAEGDPLEITTRVDRAWIAGREVDLGQDMQRRLYEKYRRRPRP